MEPGRPSLRTCQTLKSADTGQPGHTHTSRNKSADKCQCMCVLARHQPAQTPTANADTENMVLATGH
eukprot:12034889-Alexandrium_andersonii.AAC.1